MMKLIILLVIVKAIYCYYEFIPVSGDRIPKFKSDDIIEFYNLQAGFLKNVVGDSLEYLNLMHVAIGFKSLNTNETWTLDFDTIPNITSSLFPEFVIKEDNDILLKWSSKGAGFCYLDIPEQYWTYKMKLGTMKGNNYNRFREWIINSMNNTYTNYYLFEVYSKWNNINEKQLEISSFNCHDFSIEIYEKIKQYGKGEFIKGVNPKRTFINLYVSEKPIEVSFYDPRYHARIISFFQIILLNWNELNIVQFISTLKRIYSSQEAFIWKDGKYYLLKMKQPYLDWKYNEIEINK